MRCALLVLSLATGLAAQSPQLPLLAPINPESSEGPTVIHRIDPVYTPDAMDARVEGTVILYAEIGIDGRAHNIRVIKSLGHGLDEAAIATVGRWQFAPAIRFGRRVAAPSTIDVEFRLSDNLPVRV